METTSKLISGLPEGSIPVNPSKYYSETEKRLIIKEYLDGYYTKREIWQKYTGRTREHGNLLRWMRQLGYSDSNMVEKPTFVSRNDQMKKKKDDSSRQSSESFDILQLRKRIEELENQLKDAEMKAVSYSTMIDIAEKEFNIPIRKKSDTKPSKK
jgi:hypothetical protein